MTELHDFAAGVTIAGLTFRIAPGLPAAHWYTSQDQRHRKHGDGIEDDLTPRTIRAIRNAKSDEEEVWEVVAAESLRDPLREVVEALEAEQRRATDAKASIARTVIDVDDLREGVTIANTLFAINPKLEGPAWAIAPGHSCEEEVHNPATLRADTVLQEMDRPRPLDGKPLEITASPDLADDFLAIVREVYAAVAWQSAPEPPSPDGSVLIAVVEGLDPETWRTDDPRFSARPRDGATFTAELLVDLVHRGVRRIEVASVFARVTDTIDSYNQLRDVQDDKLPPISVRFERTLEVTITADLVGLNLGETEAAVRAVDAHRRGKLLVVLDPEDVAAIHTEEGHFIIDESAPNADKVWARISDAIIEAKQAVIVPAEVQDDDLGIQDGYPKPDPEVHPEIVYFYGGPGEGFSFRFCPHYVEGQWGCDYQPLRQGGLSSHTLAEMMSNGGQHFGFSRDLVPYAMTLLQAMGKVERRDLREWVNEVFAESVAAESRRTTGPTYAA